MCFNKKINCFWKLVKFLNKTPINKATNYKHRTNNLLFNYHKVSTCVAMIKSTLLRHAQTQHADESYDLGNILLCKANLFQDSKSEKVKHDNAGETLKTNDQNKTETSVTFFEVGDIVSAETEVVPPTIEIQPLKQQNSEKRKSDDTEDIKDVKKPKLDPKTNEIKRPGFTDERYNETSYYFENGLRKVYPYHFTFTTYTKGRWVGEKILDVFSREFRAHPVAEYERSIETGSLTVNYEKVPVDYRLKHNDLLANTVHRHEVPVTGQPITIVHIDDEIVVVNKPASIPVHPCGRYRHNTVVFILAKEYNLKNLRTIHRLDRLTSGLLLFGRSPNKARQLEHEIRNREVQKEYICRVEGEFPDGIVECNEPILVVSFKIGVCKVSPKGKDCKTTFERISYNGKTSVLLCKPLTGRMHQIRVHLQYLGFPVVNDPLYNHEVFGPLKGRGGDIGGRTDEELVRDLISIHNAENWLGIEGAADVTMFNTREENGATEASSFRDKDKESTSSEDLETCAHKDDDDAVKTNAAVMNSSGHKHDTKSSVATQTEHEFPDLTFNAKKMTFDKYCYDCTLRYRDPQPKDLVMYLHAWKYKGLGWEYETPLPDWGNADWIETN